MHDAETPKNFDNLKAELGVTPRTAIDDFLYSLVRSLKRGSNRFPGVRYPALVPFGTGTSGIARHGVNLSAYIMESFLPIIILKPTSGKNRVNFSTY